MCCDASCVVRSHAFLLGADKLVLPGLVEESIAIMGDACPDVVKNRDFITGVITREEERFRQTLRTGLSILEDELSDGVPSCPARRLQAARHVRLPARGHDGDHGRARGRGRRRASTWRWPSSAGGPRRRARPPAPTTAGSTAAGSSSSSSAPPSSSATVRTRATCVLAVVPVGDGASGEVEIFTDRTPFCAESGGQVGDTGTISPRRAAPAERTRPTLPGLRRHAAVLEEGDVTAGQAARRHRRGAPPGHPPQPHATHVLHWALRKVLGEHVKQAGVARRPGSTPVRLQPLRGGHARRDRRDRGAGGRGGAGQRPGPRLRDHARPRRRRWARRVLR